MARKTIFVSDFSNKEIVDEKQSATITVKYGDGRRGILLIEAYMSSVAWTHNGRRMHMIKRND